VDDLADALEGARAGDPAAFADLYRAVQPRLLRYARVLVGRDAEDVTAEAWLQIVRDLERFVGNGADFRAWCATIVRHRALDQRRALARRPCEAADDSVLLDVAGDADPVTEAEYRMSARAAVGLIGTLPQDQAEAVLLRAVLGLDVAAAAAVLGKSPGAVRVAAHRGLKTLAAVLEARPQPVGDGHV
jgi:RNA polymerase sigma-70 factor (ECF subfamily)